MKKENKIKPSFLKRVTLSGYKSVQNVDVELKKGLNIIIGKNAAGKTNFLSFLNKSLAFSFEDVNHFSATLVFENGKEYVLKFSHEINKESIIYNGVLGVKEILNSLTVEGELIPNPSNIQMGSFVERNQNKGLFFTNTFIHHGIPSNYLFLDAPFSYKADEKNFSSTDLLNLMTKQETPFFVKTILTNIYLDVLGFFLRKEEITLEGIKENIKVHFSPLESIKRSLIRYSPVEDVRLSDNFNVFKDETKEIYTVNNLFIEFKVEGSWQPFSNLSDGTKRLFYIISEIAPVELFQFSAGRVEFRNGEMVGNNRIILLEEPELGVHPHQLMQLMQFLKESSRDKQIIISTHSPQVLDVLSKNELDKIILAYADGKEGTKLRHLTEKETKKALAYIKEDFLSDYWLYSDLEK